MPNVQVSIYLKLDEIITYQKHKEELNIVARLAFKKELNKLKKVD